MLLGDGRLGDAEILQPETARLARSNLMAVGTARDNVLGRASGYGAGVFVARDAGRLPFHSAGTVSHSGATGTMWFTDPTHRAILVFMTQTMPPPPGRGPALLKAIEADLG